MSDLRTIVHKPDHSRVSLENARPMGGEDAKQRRYMTAALCLLLLALGLVLWHDRDFWFPDTADTENRTPRASSPSTNSAVATSRAEPAAQLPDGLAKPHLAATPRHRIASAAKAESPAIASSDASAASAPMAITTSRTVLPPLEVEVVAGDTRHTVRSGSSSVRVELQPAGPAEAAARPESTETASKVISNAAERVQMSTDASAVVTSPVRPDYPLLARQMKVQGSVVLQALIGRDGTIQNLQVVSGPHILASAAEDAVRQWHFKPHFQDNEAVETQAKITVNFTISTN